MKVKDIIKELQEYENQDYELVYDMFSEDDIRSQAEEMQTALSDEQIKSVIAYLERHADASEGMSWETIEFAINSVLILTIQLKE